METFSARTKRLLGLDWAGKLRTSAGRLKGRYHVAMARLRRWRTNAAVIGITGSSAKSTTAELLAHILEGSGTVHKLTIGNTFRLLVGALRRMPSHTDYVVMEIGASGHGTIAPMASLLKPNVAIVTMVADEHRSAFRGVEAVAAEKRALVERLPANGIAILNADDRRVMAMAGATTQRIVTFGRDEHAQYRADEIVAAYPRRLTMTMHWPGGVLPLRTRFVAEHFWLPVAAAAAAALELGVDPDTVMGRIASFDPLFNRCGVLETPQGPTFLIDTAKAPLHSLGLAFDMLDRADATHKRVVLGHISDYAGKADATYRKAYRDARAIAQETIFVGDHAHRAGAPDDDRRSGRFREMSSVRDVAEHIRATQRPDEVILIKGSRNLHLERVGLALTRDVHCWENVCGFTRTCLVCGKYAIPFEKHREISAQQKRSPRWWRRLFLRPSA